jgi:hypothetical protein
VGPSAVVLVNGPPVAAASTRASVQALTGTLERVPQVAGAVSAYTSVDPMLRGEAIALPILLVSSCPATWTGTTTGKPSPPR